MDDAPAWVYELPEEPAGPVGVQTAGANVIDFGGNLRAAQAGDENAFAAIWREFHPQLLRYLRMKTGSEAEDLAADTWFQIVRALRSFEGDEDGFRAWIYTSARNRMTDWYRGSHRRPDAVDVSSLLVFPATSDVEFDVEVNSATDAALALIASLPPDQAEAVMLRFIAGLNVSAVAKIMVRTPGSVRVLCHRGLRRLEARLRSEPSVSASDSVGMDIDKSAAGAHR